MGAQERRNSEPSDVHCVQLSAAPLTHHQDLLRLNRPAAGAAADGAALDFVAPVREPRHTNLPQPGDVKTFASRIE